MAARETLLDWVYHWEETTGDRTYLTQPMGGGSVKTWTWKEAVGEARRMATHLKSLDFPAGTHIALISKNCSYWIMCDLAIWMAGHVSVPLYPTLTSGTVGTILEHSDAKLLFVGKLDGWDGMKDGVPEGMPTIAFPLSPEGNDYEKWADIVAKAEPLADPVKRTKDELATLIYTSGSTGQPKGVMMSFGAAYAAAAGVIKEMGVTQGDRMLSYLPLAHSFERMAVESNSLMGGYQLFFAEKLATFQADLVRAKPTVFISVPRLWLKFQLGVFRKMPPKRLSFLLKIPFVRGIIQKKILGALGLDSVRFAASGSAPIPGELIDWYRALGLELLEGYGMTENLAYSHITKPGQVRVGYVGSPLPGVECKTSEAGEILVKSPATMQGYYKMDDVTKASFTEDGFLKTGDRGEIDSMQRLKITGRVKELFKTSKGKYVAPAPIENKLMASPRIEAACVGGNGQVKPHALIMLGEQTREDLAKGGSRGPVQKDLEALLAEVNGSLDPHERLKYLAVVKDEWVIENGFLTPTMKIKRNVIEDTYSEFSESCYEKTDKVCWQPA